MATTSSDTAASRSLDEATARVRQAAVPPLRAAFLARALNALARLTPQLTERSVGDAAGAASDYTALLTALESPEALATLGRDDPLAAARLRGVEARNAILAGEGGTLPVAAVAEHLGITRQAVDKRRRAGRLIGLDIGRRGYAYPAWQFATRGLLPGLDDALAVLPVREPWMRAAFFLGSNSALDGEAPLAVLRRGDTAAVQRAAATYGEQGAL